MRNDDLQAHALRTLNTDDSRRQPWQSLVQLASCHVQKVTDHALADNWHDLLPQEMISDVLHVAVHLSVSNRHDSLDNGKGREGKGRTHYLQGSRQVLNHISKLPTARNPLHKPTCSSLCPHEFSKFEKNHDATHQHSPLKTSSSPAPDPSSSPLPSWSSSTSPSCSPHLIFIVQTSHSTKVVFSGLMRKENVPLMSARSRRGPVFRRRKLSNMFRTSCTCLTSLQSLSLVSHECGRGCITHKIAGARQTLIQVSSTATYSSVSRRYSSRRM